MNCTVGGSNVKGLAKAIQALARIGDDMYIQSQPSSLVFRTVNSSRSAYVCFTFKQDFFVEYKGDVDVQCKVSLKSCIMAFKSLPTMEKTVEKCLIDTTSVDSFLLVQFCCKHDLTKIYHLPFIDNETVQAVFQQEVCPCKLTAQTRLLLDGIQNFSSAVEEITLTVTPTEVTLKNYIDNDQEQSKVVHTEITLKSQEFENYDVDRHIGVTFCLKEFKAVLGFAEGGIITISCDCGGKPIIFNVDNVNGIESEFVLATVTDRPSHLPNSQASFLSIPNDQDRPSASNSSSRRSERSTRVKNKVKKNYTTLVENLPPQDEESAPHSSMSTVPLHDDIANNIVGMDLDACLDDDIAMDEIPSTPPSKKFRAAFLGLSQSSSQYTTVMPENEEVLVAASDDES